MKVSVLAVVVAMCLITLSYDVQAVDVPDEFYSEPMGMIPLVIEGDIGKFWDNGTKSVSNDSYEVETRHDNLVYSQGLLGLATRLGDNYTYYDTDYDGNWKTEPDIGYDGQMYSQSDNTFTIKNEMGTTPPYRSLIYNNNTALINGSFNLSFTCSIFALDDNLEVYHVGIGVNKSDGNKLLLVISYGYEGVYLMYHNATNGQWYTLPVIESAVSLVNGRIERGMDGNYSVYINYTGNEQSDPDQLIMAGYNYTETEPYSVYFTQYFWSDGDGGSFLVRSNYYAFNDVSATNNTVDVYVRAGNWTSQYIHSGCNLTADASTYWNISMSDVTATRTISKIAILDSQDQLLDEYEPVITPGVGYCNITGVELPGIDEYWGNYSIKMYLVGDGNGTCFISDIVGSDGVLQDVLEDSGTIGGSFPDEAGITLSMNEIIIIVGVAIVICLMVSSKKPKRRY